MRQAPLPSTLSPAAARYARNIARGAIGRFARLDSIRRDIAANRLIIATLAASGTEVREYISCQSDAEFSMDRAVTSLRRLKRRYAEALTGLVAWAGPRLPKEPVAALACTFCGGDLDVSADRCRKCGGPYGRAVPAPNPLGRRVQDAEWPQNHDAVRFLVRTAPDARGRQDFYALWWSQGLRRGQFFRGSLGEQVDRARREGVEVEVVERFGSLRVAA